MEELDHQLSPSRWFKRMESATVLKDHFTTTKTGKSVRMYYTPSYEGHKSFVNATQSLRYVPVYIKKMY